MSLRPPIGRQVNTEFLVEGDSWQYIFYEATVQRLLAIAKQKIVDVLHFSEVQI